MANLYWVGDVSTDSMNVLNWRTSYQGTSTPSAITASDDWYFTDMGQDMCHHTDATFNVINALIWESHYETITDVAVGDDKNVGSERKFRLVVRIDVNITTKKIQLDGRLETANLVEITMNGNPLLDNNRKYITLGKDAYWKNPLTKLKLGTGVVRFYLDYGSYPFVVIDAGQWVTSHLEPTYSKNSRITMKGLEVRTGSIVKPAPEHSRRDKDYYVEITGASAITQTFLCQIDDISFGWGTLAIAGASTGSFYIPIDKEQTHGTMTGAFRITYGAYRCLKNPDVQTSISKVRAGMKMCVNHLIVDDGAILTGGYGSQGYAEIECVSMPEIHGTLTNFVQVNDGLYRATNVNENKGGLLTCNVLGYRYGGTGLSTLGTSGQVLTTDGANVYWATPSGGGGGGGSGTVTSVDMSVPTGFVISGNPITVAGTLAVSYASGYSLPTDASQANWDTAFGWGDHASAGYLTSFTETDPVFVAHASYTITSTMISNWNTAYSWGNHALAGYMGSFAVRGDDGALGQFSMAHADLMTIAGGTGITTTGGLQILTINLDNTAVTAGTYGDATNSAQITIDAQGRITNALNVPISGGGGGTTIGVFDEGVYLGDPTKINFTGAGVTASWAGTTATVNIPASGGGGGGGYPLFKHDQNPTSHGFLPFRLLVDGDTIEVGCASGGDDNADVSVFTPTQDERAGDINVNIVVAGDFNICTGREYIFHGQGNGGGATRYNGMGANPYPVVFTDTMRNIQTPPFISQVAPILEISSQPSRDTNLNKVRVIDAGKHDVIVGYDGEEEPPVMAVRVFLIVDAETFIFRGSGIPNYRLTFP